jgi:hypothetical protein
LLSLEPRAPKQDGAADTVHADHASLAPAPLAERRLGNLLLQFPDLSRQPLALCIALGLDEPSGRSVPSPPPGTPARRRRGSAPIQRHDGATLPEIQFSTVRSGAPRSAATFDAVPDGYIRRHSATQSWWSIHPTLAVFPADLRMNSPDAVCIGALRPAEERSMKAEAETLISGRSRETKSEYPDGMKVVEHLQARARLAVALMNLEKLSHSIASPQEKRQGEALPQATKDQPASSPRTRPLHVRSAAPEYPRHPLWQRASWCRRTRASSPWTN